MLQRNNPKAAQRAQATVAMGFVTGMLAGVARRKIDAHPLLAANGIDIADTASRIPVASYAALYNLLNRELDDEGFALFAQPMRVGSFEFLCRGCLSAPTLAEALQRASRFLRLVLPDLAVSVRRSRGNAELVIAETRRLAEQPDDPGRVFAFEWLLRLLHGLACWLAGRGLALDSVIFPYRKPAHFADYALIFTEDSRFAPTVPGGTGTLVAAFNANLLDLPVRRDEAALAAFLDGAPGKITTRAPASARSRMHCVGTWHWPSWTKPATASHGLPTISVMPIPLPFTGRSSSGPGCRQRLTGKNTFPKPESATPYRTDTVDAFHSGLCQR